FTKQPYIEDVGPRKIKSIQFSLFSEAEILKLGEVEVYRGVYYESTKKPIPNGLLDPRMSPPLLRGDLLLCHGALIKHLPPYYDHLEHLLPPSSRSFIFGTDFALIFFLMQPRFFYQCCSSILLDDKERRVFLKKMRNPRTEPLMKSELQKKVVKKCTSMTSGQKSVTCSKCGYMNGMVKKGQLKIIHERGNRFLDEFKAAISHKIELKTSVSVPPEIDPKAVYSLFKNMSDEDCELLYLSDRPEKLLVTSIPVPPIAIRPSVFVDGGTQRSYAIIFVL
ncbi:dna-directed rna polymerase iii subunit 1, partial [Nicotiana attenuata]